MPTNLLTMLCYTLLYPSFAWSSPPKPCQTVCFSLEGGTPCQGQWKWIETRRQVELKIDVVQETPKHPNIHGLSEQQRSASVRFVPPLEADPVLVRLPMDLDGSMFWAGADLNILCIQPQPNLFYINPRSLTFFGAQWWKMEDDPLLSFWHTNLF